jgi:D-hydroxyproline dehydrogenase subunit alpha
VRRFALGLWRRPRRLLDALFYRAASLPARYLAGVWISAASGEDRLREATLTDGSRSWNEPCDFLCCGYGLVANLELPIMMNCAVADGRVVVNELQETSVSRIFCAGELTGIGGLELALVEGEIAGLAAAGRIVEAQGLQSRRRSLAAFASDLEASFALRDELLALPRPDTVVCRCEDVTYGRLDPSWSRRQAKLYTRVGMGPCQAKVCGPALELLFGWAADSIRPPLRPTPLSTLLRAHPRENP